MKLILSIEEVTDNCVNYLITKDYMPLRSKKEIETKWDNGCLEISFKEEI